MTLRRSNKMAATLQPRLRVTRRDDIALGPGKAELLALIGKTGSIIDAARAMKMSYMRAWSLVKTMNRCFKEPLVTASRGGTGGGGAKLTASGRQVLALYQQMEESAQSATAPGWKSLQKLLRH